MRFGIVSPIVVTLPGAHGAWETTAGPEDLAQVAELADRLGYEHMTCSEHVAVPTEVAATRGGTYWDPLSTLGFLAARTQRLRLVSMVVVLGYHHPLEIVKRYGTLDRLSGGRVVLGVGVGSLREEFELIGAQFEGRGARADEAMQALRASFGRVEPVFHGEHYDYDDWVMSPQSVQAEVPMWVGGSTPRSLRRAVELGDGWVPFGMTLEQLAQSLGRHELPEGFEVVLNAGAPLDPTGRPQEVLERVHATTAAGATIVNCYLEARSKEHYLEQMHALMELTD